MEPTEESIIKQLQEKEKEWLEHFHCKTLEDFVGEHPEWQDEFEVVEDIVIIPDELMCTEPTEEYPCIDCPLRPSIKSLLEKRLRKPLWTLGDTPERKGKPKPFGFNSTARGPDEVNL